MNKCREIIVHGRVQGVGFRWATRDMARKLGIKGFVKNLDDGSVYIHAEGNEVNLDMFINWCRKGPDHANVNEVNSAEKKSCNYSTFEVKY